MTTGREDEDVSTHVSVSSMLGEGILLLHRLREQRVANEDMVWVLPTDTLPDLAGLYGLRVLHADVPFPLLAHRAT